MADAIGSICKPNILHMTTSVSWGYISRFSSHSSTSRGVAVLFKNSFEFHINQEIIDECGNFIILDINIQDYRMTLVAIYGPNEDNPDFF